MQPQRTLLLQALASMAWADGHLDTRQREILDELFDDEHMDAELARQWLREPVDFPDPGELKGLLPDGSDRMDLVMQLMHLAMADRWFHPKEMSLLRRLGEDFGIDEAVLEELDQNGA
ncbi:TerB family tellurite resistance protein [bacterium]|nr:TerB family tellurite resistance protein [bacterium]